MSKVLSVFENTVENGSKYYEIVCEGVDKKIISLKPVRLGQDIPADWLVLSGQGDSYHIKSNRTTCNNEESTEIPLDPAALKRLRTLLELAIAIGMREGLFTTMRSSNKPKTNDTREYIEGGIGRYRWYVCRTCRIKFKVFTSQPVPEKERLCNKCRGGQVCPKS